MRNRPCGEHPEIRDYGDQPLICNIHHATTMNRNFRTTLWTGQDMQLTLMSIPVCGDIGVEMHDDVDQFVCIESGTARIYMGSCRAALQEMGCAIGGYAVIIPAGTWHNIVNAGSRPLKLYSIYSPPAHPKGTVNKTKADAEH